MIKYAERQCKATESLINKTNQEFLDTQEEDNGALAEIQDSLQELKNQLPDLNKAICDGQGDSCEDICGGAGCGSCGDSVACAEGAKQKIETAISLSNETERILREKEAMANEFIRNVPLMNITQAKALAEEAHNRALKAHKDANSSMISLDTVTKKIQEFLNQNTTSEEMKVIAEEILKKDIKSSPNQIKDLAEKIRKAVQALTNIDPIIEETRDDLEKVKQLKEDADNAK